MLERMPGIRAVPKRPSINSEGSASVEEGRRGSGCCFDEDGAGGGGGEAVLVGGDVLDGVDEVFGTQRLANHGCSVRADQS